MFIINVVATLVAFSVLRVKADVAPEYSFSFAKNFVGNILNNAEVTAGLNSSLNGAVSFSGGCANCGVVNETPDANFTALHPSFDFTDAWVGIAFDSLNLHAQVSVDLHPTSPTHEISQPLYQYTWSANEFSDSLAVDLTLELEFHGWLNTTQAVNITYDFDVVVPAGSVIWFPIEHLEDTSTIGFNETSLVPGVLTSTTSDLDIKFQYSLRPLISLSARFLEDNHTATLYADIPYLDLDVSPVSDVTATCDPAPAGAPATQVFNNLTHVVPSIGYDVIFNANSESTDLASGTLAQLPTACLEFFSQSNGGVTGFLATPKKGGAEKTRAVGRWLVVVVAGLMIFA